MEKILSVLQGNKSYIVLVLLAIVGVLGDQGVITPATNDMVLSILVPLLGVTGAAKINRLIKALPATPAP